MKTKSESESMPNTLTGSLTVKLETILVVDDNAQVLQMVMMILRKANFQVLSAPGGREAIEVATDTKGRIDLLLSDIDMPLISGPDLGLVLKKTRPDMHVMLMSGWLTGSLPVFSQEWAYIQKPFVPTKLVELVNDVLRTPSRSPRV